VKYPFTDLQRMEFWLSTLPPEEYDPIAACMKEMAVMADKHGQRYAVAAMMIMGYMLTDELEKDDPGGNLL
jgi:hypothetical protein